VNRSRRSDRGTELAAPGDELTGVGVAPGRASGRARVVFDLSEISAVEPGDILVCSTTDPSWVPLFLIASGVVCDVGAAASHAAIVSRELGVPCVVSVRDARLRIPDGALLEIDGTKGVVRVVET
jgi:pyruvate,water dikinase